MQPFTVKLSGLASAGAELEWTAGPAFFESFGNPDILDACVKVRARVVPHGLTTDVECSIEGSVTVPCDRCLEALKLPVETGFSEVYTPEGDELDLSQDVYDYVCTSLPLQRVHEEGQCNQETVKYLSNNNI
ncbi:MAG: DUF177 domain-containing protein [Bacteroidales bacterium]|nr:DUF177 domain-containing protein [Bacteroidales bacterium]